MHTDVRFKYVTVVISINFYQDPDKADWKNCQMSDLQEEQAANSLKQKFEHFDPVD